MIRWRVVITPGSFVQDVLDEGEYVYSVGFASNGHLWALTGQRLLSLDWSKNTIDTEDTLPSVSGLRGLSLDDNRERVAITQVDPNNEALDQNDYAGWFKAGPVHLSVSDGNGALQQIGGALGKNAVGVPAWHGDDVLVPLLFDDQLAVIETRSGKVRHIQVGIAPVALLQKATTRLWRIGAEGAHDRAKRRRLQACGKTGEQKVSLELPNLNKRAPEKIGVSQLFLYTTGNLILVLCGLG